MTSVIREERPVRRRRPSRSRFAAAAIVAVALVAPAGCSDDDDGPARSDSGQITRAGSVSVFELQPADCLDPPAGQTGEIGEIRVVPCAEAHTQEVFATVVSESETYPGAEALAAEANGSCIGAMQAPDLSLSPDDGYFVSYLLPSFDGWNKDDDRAIVCVFVFPEQGEVTGSVVEQARAGTVQPGSPPPVSGVPVSTLATEQTGGSDATTDAPGTSDSTGPTGPGSTG